MNTEERVAGRFAKEVADHELTIVRQSGVYRHLRCQKPGTYSYGFDIVAWPGFLAITGDMGDFLFSRTHDMFEWFGKSGSINPHYWAQKLQAPRGTDSVREFDPELWRPRVKEWLKERCEGIQDHEIAAPLVKAVQEDLLRRWVRPNNSFEAYELLRNFEHDGERIDDFYEIDMTDWNHQFIWCCHAIVWAIGKYR